MKDIGRQKEFEEYVNKYSEQLYWKIRSIVINHTDSDDILQNVWIKVWNNLENYRGESQFSTWLYRIAINESITFLKKEKQRLKMNDEEFNERSLSQLQADTFFDGDEATILLEKALLTLPKMQRIVFKMRYFDDMKYSEIAQILNLTEGALKASYHHAVKKIELYLNS